ncbi:MobP2 family relaxase [Siminovitchia sediminis]|uniref:MobP2 family relaxase n=1 Tax=Siminovitchia sediminis TaxID=1274353 RepID=A0ABW4KKF4_9BACI
MTPAVVLKSKFVMPSSAEYKKYVDYIDREDVKKVLKVDRDSKQLNDFQVFHSYMNYMGDDEKQGSLFTNDADQLDENKKIELKDAFTKAEQNGSPLWQDVISFDNTWLEKQGIFISKTGELDEAKIKNVVREAMKVMLDAEQMKETAVWSAAIHYNTDNIHVHIATVEPFPSREKKRLYNKETNQWEEQYRAKRKQGTLDKMKSKVANMIMDRSESRNRINEIIRGAVHDKKENTVDLASFRKTKRLFQKALLKLPEDKRQWQYGYQTINDARPYIDEIVDVYLKTYHKRDMKEFQKLLDDEVQIMKELYGEGSNYQKYKQTKLDDLRKRMGNAVLIEMKTFAKKEESLPLYKGSHQKSYYQKKWQSKCNLDRAIRNLQFHMRKSYHEYQKDRNIEEFDRMLDGYER